MAYLGTKPQSGFISQEANQYFTGLTQNFIDLNQSISSLSSVIVLVNGVVQENSDLTLTSSTRITLGATLVSADKVTCIYVAKISSTQAPATGSVTSDMLSGSIANSKLANSSITLNGSAVSLGGSATVGGDNTPYFFGKKASDQTVTRNTMTNVTGFTTAEQDSDSAFDGETFTVPSGEGGFYFFSAIVSSDFGDVGNDGERFLTQLEKNGSATNMPSHDFSKASGYNIQRYANTITGLISMSAGDTMNVAVYNKDGDASGNAYVNTNSVFMGFKIIT